MTLEEFQRALADLAAETDSLRRMALRHAREPDSEDIAHDVMRHLLALSLEEASKIRDLHAYAARAVRNRVIDLAIRHAERPRNVDIDNPSVTDEVEQTLRISSDSLDPFELTVQEERLSRLRTALERLTPLERTILEELRVNGHSVRSVAQQLNLAPETVKRHVLGSLRKLREIMDPFFHASSPRKNEDGQ
jgi:RNA polymerase sigma factor (sigma-70 family)